MSSPVHPSPSTAAIAPLPAAVPAAPSPVVEALSLGRLQWADVAKGLCILLVVAHHVIGKHLPDMVPLMVPVVTDSSGLPVGGTAAVVSWWAAVDSWFQPMRMPLFFMISGMFAARAVTRPWASALMGKVVSPYWLYLVWLPLQISVFLVADRIATHRVSGVGEVVANVLVAATGLWYLYGLAVYFVLAKALVRFRWVVLAAAAVLSGAASYLPVEGVNRVSLLQCFVFFAAGAYAPQLLSQIRRAHGAALLALVVGYGCAFVALDCLDVRKSVVMLTLAPLSILIGAQSAIRIQDLPRLGAVLAALGRRTLPVYVMHMPLLGLVHQVRTSGDPHLHHLFGPSLSVGGAWGATALLAVYPVLLAGALVLCCLGFHRVLSRGRGAFLFTVPAPVRDGVGLLLSPPSPRTGREPDAGDAR